MSSSPKYSDVSFDDSTARAVAAAAAAARRRAQEAMEAERRRLEALRLEQDRTKVRGDCQRLAATLGQLRAESRTQEIAVPLEALDQRLGKCARSSTDNLAATQGLLKALAGIQRDMEAARRRFEAEKLGRALQGVARELATIKAEVAQANRDDCEKFDPGQLAVIGGAITAVQSDLESKQLTRAETAVGQLRANLEAHLKRVAAGREAFERERSSAQQAIASITDRCTALAATPDLARHLQDELAGLQPALAALASLQRAEQFATVHQQTERLTARVDGFATAAQTRIEQAEHHKAITQRVIDTVISTRGILLAGYPQQDQDKAVLRFRMAGSGVLHMEIGASGAIEVLAQGFKFDQRRGPDGGMEKSCDGFVAWFEQIRQQARAQGLEIKPLRWDGQPTRERGKVLEAKKVSRRCSTIVRHRGGGR